MLVLASSSPRRQELLRNARCVFKVIPAHIEEQQRDGESPAEYARRLARDKARAVFDQLARNHGPGGLFVLGADTIVVVDGHVLEKPADEEDAARMLKMLSGRAHEVTTGVCLVGPDFEDVRSESTQVSFTAMGEDEIADYIATGEPMDKAGAYGIQGMASRWVSKVEGCYFNVVGLPVQLVYRMLHEHSAI